MKKTNICDSSNSSAAHFSDSYGESLLNESGRSSTIDDLGLDSCANSTNSQQRDDDDDDDGMVFPRSVTTRFVFDFFLIILYFYKNFFFSLLVLMIF